MNALLLCAGLGTRFLPVTEHTPKPAILFLDVPLMGYSLFYLEQLGLKNLVINTHHLPAAVRGVAECLTFQRPYRVQFSHEPEILGSGGGIRQAEKMLLHAGTKDDSTSSTADFIVANGDEVILFSHSEGLKPLLAFHHTHGALATLLTTNHPEAGRTLGGVWVEPGSTVLPSSGRIIRLGGTHPDPGAQHFTGVFVFSPRIFSYMPAGGVFHIFKDCLHKAMAAGERVMAYHDPGLLWLDMSSAKDHALGTSIARKHLADQTLPGRNLAQIIRRYNPQL